MTSPRHIESPGRIARGPAFARGHQGGALPSDSGDGWTQQSQGAPARSSVNAQEGDDVTHGLPNLLTLGWKSLHSQTHTHTPACTHTHVHTHSDTRMHTHMHTHTTLRVFKASAFQSPHLRRRRKQPQKQRRSWSFWVERCPHLQNSQYRLCFLSALLGEGAVP